MTAEIPSDPKATFRDAVAAWERALGQHYVLTDSADVAPYARCTLPLKRKIAAVLRPHTVAEVQELARIATSFGQPIHPVSTGRNWGYGTACPVLDNVTVVDLQRMNHVIEVNEELAYTVIEPGVSQRQLADHLRDNRIPLWMDPTGASPTCSVLGNTLERGFGITPYSDHFLATCGLEVVLPTGKLLKTGFWHIPEAKTKHLFKWGLGPYLDGLFTQSNLGIVTKVGIWLMPVPEHFEAFYFKVESDRDLEAVIEPVRTLRQHGIATSPVNFLSRVRVVTLLHGYPWEAMGVNSNYAIPDTLQQRLGQQTNTGAWNVSGALYGTREQVRAAKHVIRRTLPKEARQLLFLSEERLRLISRFKGIAGRLTGYDMDVILGLLRKSFGIMRGQPSEVSMPTSYWRNRHVKPIPGMDPAADSCGLIWFSPIVPFSIEDIKAANALGKDIFEKHGFDYCPTMTAVSGRCLDCTLPILYNKQDKEETARAESCYEALLDAFIAAGYPPYRVPVTAMNSIVKAGDSFWETVGKIKAAVDPSNILAPGRYSP